MSAHAPRCPAGLCEDCEDDLPIATHSETMEFAGMKVKVHVLDDGRRIVDADDFNRVLQWMAGAKP